MGLFELLKADEALAKGETVNVFDQMAGGVPQPKRSLSLFEDLAMDEYLGKQERAAAAADAENSTWGQDELLGSILAETGAAGLGNYGKASADLARQEQAMRAWEAAHPVEASVPARSVQELQGRLAQAQAEAEAAKVKASAQYDRINQELNGMSRTPLDFARDLGNAWLQTGASGMQNIGDMTGIDAIRQVGKEGGRIVSEMLASDRTKKAMELAQLAQSDPRLAAQFNFEHPGEAFAQAYPSAMASLAEVSMGGRLPLMMAEQIVGKRLPAALASRIVNRGVAGANSWLNGAGTGHEVFEQTQDPIEAIKAALTSAAVSRVANLATEGGAAGSLARAGVGQKMSPSKTLRNIGLGSIKEPTEEVIENRGDFYGKRAAGLNPSWDELFASDINAMLPSALMGAHSGAMESFANRGNQPPTSLVQQALAAAAQEKPSAGGQAAETQTEVLQPITERVQPVKSASQDDGSSLAAAITALGNQQQAQTQPEPAPAPQPTQEPQDKPEPQQTPAPDQFNDVSDLPERVDQSILQNRKRDQRSSIKQMLSIANNPDYGRTGFSRDFGNGSPVVAFGSIPAEQRGSTSYAVTAKGERIPVQYAVVEADDVATSNTITGAMNPDYGLTANVTAVAGNGRMAGLAEAYRSGKAQQYRQEMTEDSALHGVSPDVIKGMKHPVLVRIMPNSRVKPGIADESNTSSNQQLNAVEQAQNDAGRVDLDSLTFNEDGSPSKQSIDSFILAMPETERAGMVDAQGRAAVQAVDRLNNAIFSKAYKNDALAAMYSQATDPEARLVLGALAKLAPKMARLDGSGELDFRNALVDAVNAIVQGKRQGLKMSEIVQQVDALADPDTQLFIQLFARNPRSTKEAVRILSDAADFVYAQVQEAQNPTGDMFGNAQPATRADVMNRIRSDYEQSSSAQATAVQNQGRSVSPVENAAGRDARADQGKNDAGRSADAQPNESIDQQTGQVAAGEKRVDEGLAIPEVNSDEIHAAKTNSKEFRDEVKRRLAEKYPEGTVVSVTIQDDQLEVLVSKRSGLHSLGRRASWRTMLATLKLEDLIRVAKRVSEFEENPHRLEGREDSKQILGGWRYQSKIRIDGLTYPVDIRIVQHEDQKNRLRNLKVEKTPDGYLEQLPESSGVNTRPLSGVKSGTSSSDLATNGTESNDEVKREFGLIGQTEQEAQAEDERLQRIREDEEREQQEADERARADRIAREEKQAADKAVDHFSLADDTVSAEDAVSGQNQLKFSRDGKDYNAETADSVRQAAREDLGDSLDLLEKGGRVTVAESEDQALRQLFAERNKLADGSERIVEGSLKEIPPPRNNELGRPVPDRQRVFDVIREQFPDATEVIVQCNSGSVIVGKAGFKHSAFGQHANRETLVACLHVVDLMRTSVTDNIQRDKAGNALPEGAVGGAYTYLSAINIDGKEYGVVITVKPDTRGNRRYYDLKAKQKTPEEQASRSIQGQTGGIVPRRTSISHVDATGSTDIVADNVVSVKYSTDGKLQGVYDPTTGKSWIIAGNIPKGNATGVVLHEIGIHMAADPRHNMNMQPLLKRGMQIVNVGAANGDPTATAAKKRLLDAGEKPTDAEEATAYLVEEIVNRREKVSAPILRWWNNLKAMINGWLIRHGFRDVSKLTAEDYADLAVSNVRALARASKQAPVAPAISAKDAFAISRSQGKGASPTVPAPVAARLRCSRTPWNAIIGKDELGNTRFEAGAKAYSVISNGMYRLFDLIDEKANNQFNLGMMRPEMRKLMRQFKADKDNIMRNLEPIVREMSEWPENERRMVSDIIEKELKTGVIPPNRVLKVAGAIQSLMDSQTDELVRLGGISKETADRWRGRYLPRIYMRNANQIQRTIFEDFFGRNKPIESITGKHLKARGMFDTMTTEHEIADVVSLGWEVRDPNWEWKDGKLNWIGPVEQKELFADRPEALIAEGVTVWRDFTPEERASMGEVRDALSRFVLGFMSTQRDIAVMKLYEQLANDRRFSRMAPAEGFVRVPDTTIEESGGVKRYGALAGKYVSREVWSQLVHQTRIVSEFGKAYRKLLAGWKEGKTALNPVAHFNNTVSNLTMAHFAGVSYWDVNKYVDAAREMAKGEERSSTIKEAYKYGLFSGSFTKEEMASLVPDETLRQVLQSSEGGLDKAIDIVNGVLSWGLRSKLRKAYEFEDSFFKLVIYMDARKHGLSPEDAVDHATRYIFTYDDLPSGAAAIRDMPVLGIPFFAWTYKAVPALTRTLFEHPLRFAAPGAVLGTMNLAMYWLMAGASPDDDDYWDRMERAWKQYRYESNTLPDYMKGNVFAPPKALRLWNDSLTGFAQFLDTSRIVPGVDFLDFNNQMGGIGVPQSMMPSSPVFGLTMAMISNKDPFTGGEIVNKESDTEGEKWQKRGAYLAKNLSPSLAPWSYHGTRLANAISYETGAGFLKDAPGAKDVHEFLSDHLNMTGYTGNHVPMTMARAAEHTTGIKNRLVDFGRQEDLRKIQSNAEVRQIQSDLRSKARQLQRGTISRAYFDRERQKAIEKIQLVRQREKDRQADFPKP